MPHETHARRGTHTGDPYRGPTQRGPTQGTHTGDPHRGEGPTEDPPPEGRATQRTHHRRGGPHRGPTQNTHRHLEPAFGLLFRHVCKFRVCKFRKFRLLGLTSGSAELCCNSKEDAVRFVIQALTKTSFTWGLSHPNTLGPGNKQTVTKHAKCNSWRTQRPG